MLVWRCRRQTPLLDLDRLPASPERQLRDALLRTGMNCTVRLITQDIAVPVFLVVLTSVGGVRPLVVLAPAPIAHLASPYGLRWKRLA